MKPTVVLYFAVIMYMCITIVATFFICKLHVNSKDNIDYRKCHLYIVGLDGAGKTTLLYRIKLGEVIDAVPSIGRGAKGFLFTLPTERQVRQIIFPSSKSST